MRASGSFVLKGDVAYSLGKDALRCVPGGYLVCVDGVSRGVFDRLPERYAGLPMSDEGGALILPGMVDLHIHAPQYAFRGTGMDLELLPWLEKQTFPEEARYEDEAYAARAYGQFADALRRSATTRACVFATRHRRATELLMELMEGTGLISYVGKINMDRASTRELQENGPLDSAYRTFGWLNAILEKFSRTLPILTPRFIPSCTDELLGELHEIQMAYDLPVQSHLSENRDEVEWVRRLCPEARFYGDAYDRHELFGTRAKTIMAHCVYSCDDEIELIKRNGVFVAHCPASNINLCSGIAPIRRYLDEGLRVGLGSDVAGGQTESIFRAMTDAVQASKLYWRLIDERRAPIRFEEAFYMATLGGGAFFGQVGGFEPGYELDAIVLDDASAPAPTPMTIRQRVERAAYLSLDSAGIRAKYIGGRACSLDPCGNDAQP